MNPICIIRAVWRTLISGQFVSGHDFKTASEKTPPNVHVLECQTCGHVSVAWSRTSMESQK